MFEIILGAISLGLLWAIMTIGVYITYRILDIADLTVEGSIAMGAAIAGFSLQDESFIATCLAFVGGMLAGLVWNSSYKTKNTRVTGWYFNNDCTLLGQFADHGQGQPVAVAD